jgi:hypothetical protein
MVKTIIQRDVVVRPMPTDPDDTLDHLVTHHGWTPRPAEVGMIQAHRYAHGLDGPLDIADPDLAHVHGAPAPTKAAPNSNSDGLVTIAAAIAGGLAGLLLPWVKAIAPFLGQLSITGLDTHDGKMVGAGLLFLAFLALWESRKSNAVSRVLLVVGFLVITAVAAYDYHQAAQRIAELDSDYGSVTVGAGLYVCGAAGAVGAIASFARMIAAGSRD